jgi:hypothetical protein
MCFYGPGSVLVGTLWVEQDDMEDALEILAATPGVLNSDPAADQSPEMRETEIDGSFQSEPDFPSLLIGFVGFFGALAAGYLVNYLFFLVGVEISRLPGFHVHFGFWILGVLVAASSAALMTHILFGLMGKAKREGLWGRCLLLIAGLVTVVAVAINLY